MAPPLPDNIPLTITAGDSLQWLRRSGDYPATDGWVLHYTLLGATAIYTIDGTASGEDYAVSVDAATTAGWAPGKYQAQEYITNPTGLQRITLRTFALTIAPNLVGASPGLDTRSHAQKMLDAINTWLESKAPVAGSMEINGRKISYYPLADLLKLQSRYQLLVNQEQASADGRTGGTRTLVQF